MAGRAEPTRFAKFSQAIRRVSWDSIGPIRDGDRHRGLALWVVAAVSVMLLTFGPSNPPLPRQLSQTSGCPRAVPWPPRTRSRRPHPRPPPHPPPRGRPRSPVSPQPTYRPRSGRRRRPRPSRRNRPRLRPSRRNRPRPRRLVPRRRHRRPRHRRPRQRRLEANGLQAWPRTEDGRAGLIQVTTCRSLAGRCRYRTLEAGPARGPAAARRPSPAQWSRPPRAQSSGQAGTRPPGSRRARGRGPARGPAAARRTGPARWPRPRHILSSRRVPPARPRRRGRPGQICAHGQGAARRTGPGGGGVPGAPRPVGQVEPGDQGFGGSPRRICARGPGRSAANWSRAVAVSPA